MDSQNRPYYISEPTELPALNYNSQMKIILSKDGIYVLRGDVLNFWGFKNDNSKSLGEPVGGAESRVSEIFEPESVLASVLYRQEGKNFKAEGSEVVELTGLPTAGPLISGSNGICHFDANRAILCQGYDKGQFGIGFPTKPAAAHPLPSTLYGSSVLTGF